LCRISAPITFSHYKQVNLAWPHRSDLIAIRSEFSVSGVGIRSGVHAACSIAPINFIKGQQLFRYHEHSRPILDLDPYKETGAVPGLHEQRSGMSIG